MIKNVMANECFNILKAEESSRLIDVRTSHEWQNDGYADLKSIGKKAKWAKIRWITRDDNYRARALYDKVATKTDWAMYEMDIDLPR